MHTLFMEKKRMGNAHLMPCSDTVLEDLWHIDMRRSVLQLPCRFLPVVSLQREVQLACQVLFEVLQLQVL